MQQVVAVKSYGHTPPGTAFRALKGRVSCTSSRNSGLSQTALKSQLSWKGDRIPITRSVPWATPGRRQLAGPRAAKGPPKKGRGVDARKASFLGEQRFRQGGDKDLDSWTLVAEAGVLVEGENKAIILDGKGYVLVPQGEDVYAVDASCSSCKFPMIQGKMSQSEDGRLRLECPLCHSKFFLEDGSVAEWCPKDGVAQWMIGTLMSKVPPAKLNVHPARYSKAGKVYVQVIKRLQVL